MRERENGLPVFIGADSFVYEALRAAYFVRGSDNRFLNREMSDMISLMVQDIGLSSREYI
jgi:hypothetical protein